ncbi:hypothetical protein P3G55_23720 [Leptospira sp. 96542]|nr:hypothetical protein [Leptospira sp. 96542]
MAATSIEKIPSLKGEQAVDFVKKAESTKSRSIPVSDQQKKIYAFLVSKSEKSNP